MILIPFDKASDIILALARRGHVLGLFETGLLSPGKNSVPCNDPNRGLFGIQKGDGVIFAVADYEQNTAHHSIRFNVHFDKATPEEIKHSVRLLQKMAAAAGALKISLIISSDQDTLADKLRELDFAPEVRLRQHVFVGGHYYSVSEYGCIL